MDTPPITPVTSGFMTPENLLTSALLQQENRKRKAEPRSEESMFAIQRPLFTERQRHVIGPCKKVYLTSYRGSRRIAVRETKDDGSSQGISLTAQEYEQLYREKEDIVAKLRTVSNDKKKSAREILHLGSGRFVEINWFKSYLVIGVRQFFKSKRFGTYHRSSDCGISLKETELLALIAAREKLVEEDILLADVAMCFEQDGHVERECKICNPFTQ